MPFEPAEAILERARRVVQNHSRSEYAARIAFLASGLEHARLAGRLAALFDGQRDIPADSPRFDLAVWALGELAAFRQAHQEPFGYPWISVSSATRGPAVRTRLTAAWLTALQYACTLDLRGMFIDSSSIHWAVFSFPGCLP
jgi:hypothetical protein